MNQKLIFIYIPFSWVALVACFLVCFSTRAQVQARWSLNNDANDSGGSALHGSLTGSPTFFSPGKVGAFGINLNGTNQFVNLGNPNVLPQGGENRSIGAWAKSTDVTGIRTIVAFGTAANGQSMFIGQNGTSLIAGAFGSTMTVPSFWTNGIWHHVAITYDGTSAVLYADGVQVASTAATWDIVLSKAYIGRNVNDSEYWKGSVDDVYIEGIAWTSSRILNITKMASTRVAYWPFDGDATNFEGPSFPLTGDPTFTDLSKVGKRALVLNGSTQYLDAGSQSEFASGSAPRSLSAWAKTSIASGTHTIISYGTAATGQSMFIGQSGTTLVAGAFGNTVTVPGFWSTGVWHHICLTYNGEIAKLYADGVQVASVAKSWSLVLSKVYVGRNINGTEYWNGVIDDARVYSTNLLLPEIQAMAALPAGPTGLTGTSPGTSQIDLSWNDNASNELQYEVERLDFYAPGYSHTSTLPANSTSYTQTSYLVEGTAYTYRVRAVNSAGNSDFASVVVTTPSTSPTELMALTTSASSIQLRWYDKSNTETGYRIERSVSATTGFALVTTTAANVMTYSNSGITAGTTYYYRVCAVNAGGNSDYSNVASSVTLTSSQQTTMQTALDNWAYEYQYDDRGRITGKKAPGSAWFYMIYDDRDRVVLTQDGVQRAATPTKEWTFMKYDEFDRPVLTGLYASNNTVAAMQTAVDTYYSNLTSSQAWFETYVGSAAGNVVGYDNKSFPQTTDAPPFIYYTATFYDKYDAFIAPTGYEYINLSLVDPETGTAQPSVANVTGIANRMKGVVTGKFVLDMNEGDWRRTVQYYDEKYRLIQSISDHRRGKITTTNIVDFTGKVLVSRRDYTHNQANQNITVTENPAYDHMNRVKFVKHTVGSGTTFYLRKNTYNELGQLVDKAMHSTDGTTFKQSVDYRYNIRGWLLQINQADVGNIAAGDATNDLFGVELAYNNNMSNLISTPAFDGNISAVQWSKGNGGLVHKQAYAFDYDVMKRLNNANHFDFDRNDGSWQSNGKAYNERNITYDLNGNILTLVRYGGNGIVGTKMDSLLYNYSGNKLLGVRDLGDVNAGFLNGTTGASTSDYDYNLNGNVTADDNKGISLILYNHLNQAKEVQKMGGIFVSYHYDGAGRKLRYNNGTVETEYIGELIYENNVLKSISHSQGRIVPDGAGWEYQYFLKDHLGNVRVTFTAKTQTPVTVSTNFESSSNSNFQNYSNQTFDLVDHTDAGTVYQKVQWLNGGVNGRVGLAKSVEVMPGDRIEFSAYCKYMNIGSTGNPNALITSLAAAFGVGPGSTGEQLKLYNGLSGWAGTGAGPDHNGDDDAVPKAFVTVLFFDRNYNLVDAAWEQVSSQGAQTSNTVKQPPHDFLSIDVRAPEAGFAYVFLSNEDPTFVDVYFDDASFTHTPSPIVGVSDYFPFGMQFYSGDRVASSPQKTLFNSKELQTDFSLNWYDFGARMFDPAIGRWHVQDPVAQFASPYIGIGNNPFNMVDPDGMSAYNDYMDDMYGEGEYDRRGESAHHWSRGTNPLSDLGGSYGERNATAHLNDIMDDFTDVERGRVVSTESDGTTSVFVDYYTLGDFMNGNVSQDEYQKYLEDFLHENFDKEIKLLNGLAAKKTKEDKEGKKYGVKFWIDPSEKYVEDITMPGAAFWSKNKQKVFITVHALPVLLAMVRNDKDLLLVIMSHELTHGIDMLNGYETYWLSWYGEETGRNIIEHHAYTTSAEMEKRLGVDFGSQRMLFRINAPPPEEYMIMQH